MKLELTFGPLSLPLSDQLSEVGVHADPKVVLHWQQDADAVVHLAMRGLLGDSAVTVLRKKMMGRIVKELNHAIVAGEGEPDKLTTAQAREQARINAERSRAQFDEVKYANQRAFNVSAARDLKHRVRHWKDQQRNLPVNGRAWEQERQVQAELDKLITQWNIREEELR